VTKAGGPAIARAATTGRKEPIMARKKDLVAVRFEDDYLKGFLYFVLFLKSERWYPRMGHGTPTVIRARQMDVLAAGGYWPRGY
jgi:hypothetical protein